MSSPRRSNHATSVIKDSEQIEEISHNRRRLLEIASVLDLVNKWHIDLHASWRIFSRIEQEEGLDITYLLDAMEGEIHRRGAIERAWLKFFMEWLQFNGKFVSLEHNFYVIPDQAGPNPIDFNKSSPLKFSNGIQLDVNFQDKFNRVDRWTQDNQKAEDENVKRSQEEIGFDQINGKRPNLSAEDGDDSDPAQDESLHPLYSQDIASSHKSGFKVSRRVLGQPPNRSAQALQRAAQAGLNFDTKYQGEIGQHAIRNADCSEDENCSVYIRNIEANAKDSEIFDEIHEGPIFQYARQGQDGKHHYHAATLVFMRRDSAEAFVNRLEHPGPGLVIRGMRLSVIFNQYRVKPRTEPRAIRQLRALQFTGPVDCLDHDGLLDFLSTKLIFNLIKSNQWIDGEKKVVQLEFASIRGQSRLAYKALQEDIKTKANGHEFSVLYVPDPCGP